ncbi:MAG: hypothetical protein RLZZ628_4016, partial [Bacteroidota bacterium]
TPNSIINRFNTMVKTGRCIEILGNDIGFRIVDFGTMVIRMEVRIERIEQIRTDFFLIKIRTNPLNPFNPYFHSHHNMPKFY